MEEEPKLDLSKGLTHAILERAVDEDPLVARAMDLIYQLEELAPEVAAWRALPPNSRGPMPPIAPAIERQVIGIMLEMERVGDELQAARERGEPPVH